MDNGTFRRAVVKNSLRGGTKNKLAAARKEFFSRNKGAFESDFINSELYRPGFSKYLRPKKRMPQDKLNSKEEEYDPSNPLIDCNVAIKFPPPLIEPRQRRTPNSSEVKKAKKTDEELRKLQLRCHYLSQEKQKIQE